MARKQSNSKPLDEIKCPVVVFLSGYRSDMQGQKARYVDDLARKYNFDYLRFDYSGHGESGGDFMDLTLSDWITDAQEVIEYNFSQYRPLILVGSSMGGWIALKLLSRLNNSVTHFVGLAPAPDFSNILMAEQRDMPQFHQQILEKTYVEAPCDYEGENFIITDKFLKDADNNSVLHEPIIFHGKVFILQGMQDTDVPYAHALRLAQTFSTDNVTLTLLKNANHRLSQPHELEHLKQIMLQCLSL
ncbi:MAG: pimeloyl-ACP methyl ester carboxylesterase [Alphaproteobacteria bacterium]|jgi:pimeloyl-ACP methyl ester carboxylesterase